MIRDKKVFGTNSNKIREKIMNVKKDLTLDKAVQISQNYEYDMEQMKQMSPSQNDIHLVRPKNFRGRFNRGSNSNRQKQSGSTTS